ncbi:CYTH domain-containing protein [Ralstonia solanacearum]|uniref:CYTH domain-containing protein n=1 Tax=Ralstonia solanacearum TaxID=305 RepID=UPI0002E0BB18|nr:CYTH domain-containing protein [Ralstonia solanacearum]MDC6179381.1 CYTH domain-containing protein [Ralstonia solanacearum]MDC6209612.1 CYTH domain-containing protein [Ralstonia solanacearum]MDC6240647.1 CYTH domain-containing protein [Ralstonia solanacearum]MDD7800019.1 CYTH domain-containing protein [Ralstonia solanacearum]TYZ51358.1 CYTH domain-containing protein [Ralstonia solanacearum]
MAREIELKLAVPAGAHDALAGWLDAHARPAGTVTLANVYYDTPEQTLASRRAALRVRRQGDQWLQTLKTAGDSGQGALSGLSARHEWEVPLDSNAISIEAFATQDAAEAADLVRPHADRLVPLFRTDFTRRLWHAAADGGEIEIALDAGAILVPGTDAREAIDELEVEWKPAARSPLDESAIAERLRAWTQTLRTAVPGLAPLDASKALRGYQLRAKATGARA